MYYGLDIGGTKIASAIVKNGEIQQRKQISTPQDDAAQAIYNRMHQRTAQEQGQPCSFTPSLRT